MEKKLQVHRHAYLGIQELDLDWELSEALAISLHGTT